MKLCTIPGCARQRYDRRLCPTHRSRLQRNGDPLVTMLPGRRPVLTYPDLRKIDAWMQLRPGSTWRKTVPVKVICARLNITSNTLHDAYRRRGGYAGCA